MIWVIANKVEEDGSFPTFKYYKHAYEDGVMDIFCAGQDDDFSFLKKDDIALVRTRDRNINDGVAKAQAEIDFRSTLETEEVCRLTINKDEVKSVLRGAGVRFPETIRLQSLQSGHAYFVKALAGSDSQGIDEYSMCYGVMPTRRKFRSLLKKGITPIIEHYIQGEDLTTVLIYSPMDNEVKAWSSIIHPNTETGFHTFESKLDFAFTPMPFKSDVLNETCKKVFCAVGARHYLRIDSRMVGGVPYILDVNMLPGLGPMGHMSKCMQMNGISYHEMVRLVVESSTN